MWDRRTSFVYGNGEADKCPSCGLMCSNLSEHARYCKGRERDVMQCPDCRLMITKDGSHKCTVKFERERKERLEAQKQRAKERAAERKEKGLVSTVRMLPEKEEMQFMELVSLEHEDWEEVTVMKHPWKCKICGLVWQTKEDAENCPYLRENSFVPPKRPHADSYMRIYGVRYVENGVPRGPYVHTITFNAIRREESEKLPEGKKWDILEAGDN